MSISFPTDQAPRARYVEHLYGQLKMMEKAWENHEVVWFNKDLNLQHLNRVSRFVIWLTSLFSHRLSCLIQQKICGLTDALHNMQILQKKVFLLKDVQPDIVILAAKCWKHFQTTFQLVGDTCEYFPQLVSPNSSDARSDDRVDEDDVNSMKVITEIQKVDTRIDLDFSLPMGVYDKTMFAIESVKNGLFAQALWVIEREKIDIDSLNLPAPIAMWMKCQQNFTISSELELDDMALTYRNGGKMGMGWGYKSANLMRLGAMAAEVEKTCTTCHIEVPPFLPFSDFEIRGFLTKQYPQLHEKWDAFLATFSDQQKQSFFAKKMPIKLPEGSPAAQILQEIRDGILKAFTAPFYITPQLQQWIEKTNPQFVIVRSTGKEDSETNSNAGGNASIPFVKPTPETISSAMGQVLASYFGEHSIRQRFSAFDASVFTEDPFMPVLIQEMIGEKVGEDTAEEAIPRSGVMLTRSEGKAHGLTEACIGLGLNEGVVTSQVSTDRYLLDTCGGISVIPKTGQEVLSSKEVVFGGITKIIQQKPTRFIAIKKPNGSYICEAIKNASSDLIHAPAIPDSVAKDLKKVADYFSKLYGESGALAALDMEFTINLCEKSGGPTIYLLQARPLLKVAKEHEPSYLTKELLETLPPVDRVRGKTLLDGGAYLRKIASNKDILICETINEALQIYLKNPGLQKTVKTVIIQQSAPSTSHEAIMFRSHGVGIVIVEDDQGFGKLQEWVEMPGASHIFVDMQRSIVARVSKLESKKVSNQGYVCYPIPLEYSMKASQMITSMLHGIEDSEKDSTPDVIGHNLRKQKIKKDLEKFDRHLQSIISACQAEVAAGSSALFPMTYDECTLHLPTHTMKDLVEIIGSGNIPNARKAIATLIHMMRTQALLQPMMGAVNVAAEEKHILLPRTRLDMIMVLENVADLICKQVIPALKCPPNSLERLYPVRLLEACLFQTGENVYAGFSWSRCLQAIHGQTVAIHKLKKTLGTITNFESALANVPLLRIEKALVNPIYRQVWHQVMKHLSSVSATEQASITEMLITLDKLDVLVEWSNVQLVKLLEKHEMKKPDDVTESRVMNLFAEVSLQALESKGNLEYCQQAMAQITTLRQQISPWSEPSHVAKHALTLAQTYRNMGFDDNTGNTSRLAAIHKKCHPLAQFAFLKVTLEAITTYDEIVKNCTGSTLYGSTRQRAINFKMLLNHYRIMMRSVIEMAQSSGAMSNSVGNGSMTLDKFYKHLDVGGAYTFGFRIPKQSVGFLQLDPISMDEEAAALQLVVSDEFDVGAIVIGNKSDHNFSSIWPSTLEEHFTCFHQNMLSALGIIKTKMGLDVTVLPAPLASYCQQISKAVTRSSGSSISSIIIQGDSVEVHLEIPLRQHAGRVVVLYNPNKGFSTRLEMFGNPEHQRWELTASAGAMIGTDVAGLSVAKPKIKFIDPKGMSFEIQTGLDMTSLQGAAIGEFFGQMKSYSMQSTLQSSYLMAVRKLRLAFGGQGVATCNEDLINGGFYMALQYADELLQSGNKTEASLVYDRLKSVRSSLTPKVGSLSCGRGFLLGVTQFDAAYTKFANTLAK